MAVAFLRWRFAYLYEYEEDGVEEEWLVRFRNGVVLGLNGGGWWILPDG